MQRIMLMACLSCPLTVCPSFGQEPSNKPGSAQPAAPPGPRDVGPAFPPVKRQAGKPVAHALLRKHVDRVFWDETQFGEVLEWLRKQSTPHGKVNVVARWRALAVEGVDFQTLVSLELEDVSVADVLDEVLDQISGTNPLVYVSRKNVLKISTRPAVRRKLYTRVYDVAEILALARAARVPAGIGISQQSRVGRATANIGGIGGTSDTVEVGTTILGDVEDDRDDDDPAGDDEIVEDFINWIQTTVEPETWQANGGAGTLSVFNGMLAVRNSADVHALLVGSFHLNE
ncbi:MAG: hypothetical protein V3W34_00050 [Phycisphaerae bacterium]